MRRDELFICKCHNIEHQLIFSYYEDDVFMSVHLLPERNIWKRFWIGIKYIFGYKSCYGDFDEFIFQPEDVHKLEKIVKHLRGEI